MSIYNTYKTPVFLIRSFFFLITAVICALMLCSITSFASPIIFTRDIYHQHTGNSGGGGCYSIQRSGTTTEEIPCGGSMVYFPAQDESKCDRCAASYHGDQSHRGCWHSETITTSYTYYDLGCNMDSSTVIGKFTVEKSTESWAKSLQLIASYQVQSGVAVPAAPFIWNGGQATAKNTYTVTQNGEYVVALNSNDNMTSAQANITVKNIDVTAPVIYSHTTDPMNDWSKEGVWVILGKVEDLQPDGSKGSGLHEKPYSYDGGKTWLAQAKYCYMENGTFPVMVRDKLGNTSSYNVTIKNMDVTAPTIYAYATDPMNDWTKEGVWITIGKVEDLQPDGSKGSGLHEQPYSFDGGKTWISEGKHYVTESGMYSVMIRDKLGNTGSHEMGVYNVDNTPPIIKSMEYDTTLNVANTTVTVTAFDLQPDGSEGSGLHEQPYSFDGGNTWSESAEWNVDKNQTIAIAVRDKMENVSYGEVVITNIDNFAPAISYEMVHPYWTNKDVNLYLHAEDKNADGSDGIGLEENWYSLDGGITWTNEEVQVYEENQEVTVFARDRNNNIASVNISIRQIDKDLPWVTISMEVIGEGEDKKVKLTAYGGDDYSGLHEEGYSWDKGCSYSRQQVKMVTENGVYQATVRDKAGNWNYEQIEVDVFEIPVIKEEKKKTIPPERDEISEVEEETTEEPSEEETETIVVETEMRVDAPQMQAVQEIEQEQWSLRDILILSCAILAALGLLFLILLLLLRTVAVYAEDEQGRMRYMGRVWIHHHEERFEVHISEWLMEQCVTTHFKLRPGLLLVKLHKKSQLCCLFPEDICIMLQVERNIDFSLV